jgi:hypothetical protein
MKGFFGAQGYAASGERRLCCEMNRFNTRSEEIRNSTPQENDGTDKAQSKIGRCLVLEVGDGGLDVRLYAMGVSVPLSICNHSC